MPIPNKEQIILQFAPLLLKNLQTAR